MSVTRLGRGQRFVPAAALSERDDMGRDIAVYQQLPWLALVNLELIETYTTQ